MGDLPGVAGRLAIDFVSIAGVGLDAADYAANDPATAGKRGLFGYERSTRVEDVRDGLASTIAVVQVPATYKGCWLAGGGSTVRGVPEANSVRPFVCLQDGQTPGTVAIMADGKVRFIPATISDRDFRPCVPSPAANRSTPTALLPRLQPPPGSAETPISRG
jgi:hypothetical protein